MPDPNAWGAELQTAAWKHASPKHRLVYYLLHFLLLRSSETYSFKLLLAQTLMPTSSSLIWNQGFYLSGFFLYYMDCVPQYWMVLSNYFCTSTLNCLQKQFTTSYSSAMKIIPLINGTIKSNCKPHQTASSLVSELDFCSSHGRVFRWVDFWHFTQEFLDPKL